MAESVDGDYSRWWAVAGNKHPRTTSLGVAYSYEDALQSAMRGAATLRKTYTVWGYDYRNGKEVWDKLRTVTAQWAMKQRNPKGRNSKRNLDPLTTMSLATATGLDTALLGRKGFRALTDKRTYVGNPAKVFAFRRLNYTSPQGEQAYEIYTGRTAATLSKVDVVYGEHPVQGWREYYLKRGGVEVPPPSKSNPEDIALLNDMAPTPSVGHIEFTPDGIERFVRDGYVYQAFSTTPVFEDGYRMGAVEAPAEEFMRVNPAKFDRCVKAVQARGEAANAYAVCTAAGTRNPGYQARFIQPDQANELMNLYHLARVPLSGTGKDTPYERMLWASKEFSKLHPEISPTGAYKDLEGLRSNWFEPTSKRGRGTRNPSEVIVQPTRSGNGKWQVFVGGVSRIVKSTKKGAVSYGKRIADENRLPMRVFDSLEDAYRKNPADTADEMYEKFHGTPPAETLEYHETLHFHGHLGGLADLVHIVVKLIGGTKDGKEVQLNAPDPTVSPIEDVVKLAANENGTQIYFQGGDQSLDLKSLGFRDSFTIKHDGESFDATEIKDNMIIGHIYRIMYRTEKEFDNFETIDYHHAAGEDTGACPFLTYDTLNNKMGVSGGSYAIHPEGIVN